MGRRYRAPSICPAIVDLRLLVRAAHLLAVSRLRTGTHPRPSRTHDDIADSGHRRSQHGCRSADKVVGIWATGGNLGPAGVSGRAAALRHHIHCGSVHNVWFLEFVGDSSAGDAWAGSLRFFVDFVTHSHEVQLHQNFANYH